MISKATRSAISSPEVDCGPSRPASPAGPTNDLSGQAPVRASRSRRRAKAEELMIQGICGRTFIASSVPDGPLSSWESRLRERLATVGSTESALIWREKVTPAGQPISRLAVSTRHTNGTGSTGSQWSTPRASDGEKGSPNQKFSAGGQPLPAQMHAQASPRVTPSARDWKDSAGMATEAGDRNRVDQLPRQMAQNAAYHPTPLSLSFKDSHQPGTNRTIEQMRAYMPTPCAVDIHRSPETVAKIAAIRKARAGQNTVPQYLGDTMRDIAAMEPTGLTPTGSPATTAKLGAPNPVFAFWLMGFPAEWISGALEAMRLYRKPRRKVIAAYLDTECLRLTSEVSVCISDKGAFE